MGEKENEILYTVGFFCFFFFYLRLLHLTMHEEAFPHQCNRFYVRFFQGLRSTVVPQCAILYLLNPYRWVF